MNLADRLKSARGSMTQQRVAELSGMALSHYRALERGRKLPSLAYAKALADVFDVSLDYLAGRTNNPKGERL